MGTLRNRGRVVTLFWGPGPVKLIYTTAKLFFPNKRGVNSYVRERVIAVGPLHSYLHSAPLQNPHQSPSRPWPEGRGRGRPLFPRALLSIRQYCCLSEAASLFHTRQAKRGKEKGVDRASDRCPVNAGLKPVSEEPVPPFYSRKILFKNFPARFTTTICTTSRFMPSCRRFRHAKLSAGRVPIQSIVKSDNCHASLTLTHIHLQCKSA